MAQREAAAGVKKKKTERGEKKDKTNKGGEKITPSGLSCHLADSTQCQESDSATQGHRDTDTHTHTHTRTLRPPGNTFRRPEFHR